MGGANISCLTPNNNQDIQIINNSEKKLGKSIINSFLGKLELFERKEIPINIKSSPDWDNIYQRILNTELVQDILHDYYPKYSPDLIPTLNGYIISKELSLKDNLVHENDYIFVSKPLFIYFHLIDSRKDFLITVSQYQIFFDVFQRFLQNECPSEYKNKLYEAYYNNRLIRPFDIICKFGIKQYDKIIIILGKDNNTKSPYNKGLEIIDRINYTYFDGKKKITVDDYKLELNGQILDDQELKNFGIINFRNLKILSLNECNIQNLEFINSFSFSNLKEINLQKNKISYFVDINHPQLEKFDLSYNNLRKNMVKQEIKENIDLGNMSSLRLNKILSLVFPRLKFLNLSHNQIENINLLSQFISGELKELDLSYNEISNIDVFSFVSFGKLKRLNLSYNKIEELNVFDKFAFCNNIEEINLMNNEIVNLNILRDVSLPNLKILNFLNNDINDYSVLRLIYFPKLEILYAFPYQLNPDKYDKNSEIFINFKNSCNHIIEKNVEVKYKL